MKYLLAIVFVLLSSSAWTNTYTTSQANATTVLEDAYIDSMNQANNRGTVTTLNFGGAAFSPPSLDLMFRDISLADSVGAGATITACTLFVHITTNFDGDNDWFNFDIYNVHRPFIENEHTFADSASGDPWNMNAPSTDFTISVVKQIKVVRNQADSFLWINLTSNDTLFEKFNDANSLPIPIGTGLADSMLDGTSAGVRLAANDGNSGGFDAGLIKVGSTENSTTARRPFFKYVYTPGSALSPQRRKKILNDGTE